MFAERLVEIRHMEVTFILPQATATNSIQQLVKRRTQLQTEISTVVHQGV